MAINLAFSISLEFREALSSVHEQGDIASEPFKYI